MVSRFCYFRTFGCDVNSVALHNLCAGDLVVMRASVFLFIVCFVSEWVVWCFAGCVMVGLFGLLRMLCLGCDCVYGVICFGLGVVIAPVCLYSCDAC